VCGVRGAEGHPSMSGAVPHEAHSASEASAKRHRGAGAPSRGRVRAGPSASEDGGSHARDELRHRGERVWLARALIAEAGWTATQTEYVAIAWVLRKRARASGRSPYVTVRTYCAGLGRHARTRRQRWVRELPADGETRPEHWPDTASWRRHRPRWQRVLQLVEEWAAGEHPDPCPRAVHWGGDMDAPKGRMRAVCARLPTGNTLYGVM